MKKYYWLVLLLPSLSFCGSNPFLEIQAKEATKHCMETSEIQNTYTPETLFQSSALCVEEEKYPQAVELYLVAIAYGNYDSARVLDKTARQALDNLKTSNFGDIDARKRNLFAEALRTRLDNMKQSCSFLIALGKPNYYPRYMVQAGENALIQKSNNSLVPNYNEKELWHDTLFTYLRCP